MFFMYQVLCVGVLCWPNNFKCLNTLYLTQLYAVSFILLKTIQYKYGIYTIHIETCYFAHWLLGCLQLPEYGDCLLSLSQIHSCPLLGLSSVRCLSSLAANLGPSFGPLCKPLGTLGETSGSQDSQHVLNMKYRTHHGSRWKPGWSSFLTWTSTICLRYTSDFQTGVI